jgi:predicted GIY-YIG superfamily endonuclease
MVFYGPSFPRSPGVYVIQTNVGYYVGSSENLAARRKTHESRLRRKSAKLSKAWANHWGNLKYVIWHLAEVTGNIEEAREKEQEIINNVCGTKFCLNATRATAIARPKAKPCYWNGKVYPSISAAENESVLAFHAIKKGINGKYLGDDDYLQSLPIGVQMKCRNEKTEFNGKMHDSLKEACEHSEWSHNMFRRAITVHGCKTEDEINKVFGVTWNGKNYRNFQLAAEESELKAEQIGKYYQQGVRSDAEFEAEKTKKMQEGREKSAQILREKIGVNTIWEGVEYNSISEAYRNYDNPRNVTLTAFSKYLKRGWSCEADVKFKKRGRKKND